MFYVVKLEVDHNRVGKKIILPGMLVKNEERSLDRLDSGDSSILKLAAVECNGAVGFFTAVDIGRHDRIHSVSVHGSVPSLDCDIVTGVVFNADFKLRSEHTAGHVESANENDSYAVAVDEFNFILGGGRIGSSGAVGVRVRNRRCGGLGRAGGQGEEHHDRGEQERESFQVFHTDSS